MANSNAKFFEVPAFKSAVGAVGGLDVLRNKATGKLFMSLDGVNYRVQGDIDSKLPMKVLVPEVDGVLDYENSCLVNIDPTKGADNIFSL